MDYNGTQVEIRRVDTDELLLSIPTEMRVASISWVLNDQELLIVTWDTEANEYFSALWDSESGKMLEMQPINVDGAGRTVRSPDNHLLATATLDDLRLVNTSTDQVVERIAINGIVILAWSPDSSRLALNMTDGTIRIWDVSDLT